MKIVLTIMVLAWSVQMAAQEQKDTTLLQGVVVRAYNHNRQLKEVGAAVNIIGKNTFERFNTTSIVAAVNTTPGVRMEERSPGSYRLAIRGSSLRSPFWR